MCFRFSRMCVDALLCINGESTASDNMLPAEVTRWKTPYIADRSYTVSGSTLQGLVAAYKAWLCSRTRIIRALQQDNLEKTENGVGKQCPKESRQQIRK